MFRFFSEIRNSFFKNEKAQCVIDYKLEVEKFFKAFDKGTQSYTEAYRVLQIFMSGREPEYINNKVLTILKHYHFVDDQNRFNSETSNYLKEIAYNLNKFKRETTKLNPEGLKIVLEDLSADAKAHNNPMARFVHPRYMENFDNLKQELSPKIIGAINVVEQEGI